MKIFTCMLLIVLGRFSLASTLAADTAINNQDFRENSELSAASFQSLTSWWTDTFTTYSCSQKCGLTDDSQTSVSMSALSRYDAEVALYTFCSNKGMGLRGNPTCSEQEHDLASESHARCRAGNLGQTGCQVDIHGYNSSSTSWVLFYERASSYDLSEELGMEHCREKLGAFATCVVRVYDYN